MHSESRIDPLVGTTIAEKYRVESPHVVTIFDALVAEGRLTALEDYRRGLARETRDDG
jgi:hypothetical protein